MKTKMFQAKTLARFLVNDLGECSAKCDASKRVCAGVNYMSTGTSSRKSPNNCKLLATSDKGASSNWISISNGKGKRKGLKCYKRGTYHKNCS
jgi:hypothetical protein